MNKNILSPSILGADFACLGSQISRAHDAGAKYLHLDVMDGAFVKSISFGMPLIRSLRNSTDMFFDVHLMINEPARYAKEFAEAGADMVSFHAESCRCVKGTLDAFKETGVKVGIALKPATDLSAVYDYIDMVDMILVMTVEPGFGGQKLIPETLDKVKELREYLNEKGIEKDIEVDGGITLSNCRDALNAGANVIVAGTSVFKGNIEENVFEFIKILNE
ncbi:MAG: ribulose-phosphate 3-epimerase [Lachnospiraceae bacterium]|jgi:ribulose-phosphate 3-epimerase|nr:ribulose-phosphate 3-epimerase [Lachnospiraceae bacterium]